MKIKTTAKVFATVFLIVTYPLLLVVSVIEHIVGDAAESAKALYDFWRSE